MHPKSREIIVSRLANPYPTEDEPFISYSTTIDTYLAELATIPEHPVLFHITKASHDLHKELLVCRGPDGGCSVWSVHAFADICRNHMHLLHTPPNWRPLSLHPTYEEARRALQLAKPPRKRPAPKPDQVTRGQGDKVPNPNPTANQTGETP